MAKHYITLQIDAKQYEDRDDCLAAAAADIVSDHPDTVGYDMSPRWADESRAIVLVDVPAYLEASLPECAVYRSEVV
jgi:hypothetical protein